MDRVVHFEVPADDTARAKKFYESIFEWKIESYPGFDYHGLITSPIDEKTRMPKEAGAINGGLLKRQAAIQKPIITIGVKDINESEKKIKKAGGKMVMEQKKVGDVGISSYFEDTEGNILGLWQELKK
ncbi:MAG TPA: VOC family protein [archaeon]|nr:VOC family protein [archaeon]